jgi:hypothetical protein
MSETMAQLMRDYNALKPKKRVVRFSSKAAGLKALAQARLRASGTTVTPPPPRNNRSAATKAQWNNKIVAHARAARDAVIVQGHGEFKSLAKAFQALNLPRTSMIRFRLNLKRDGMRTFSHQGSTYQFAICKAPSTEAS